VAYLKFIAVGLFAGAVIAKFIYIVVKTVRIVVLKIDPPAAGFDSEPALETLVQEVLDVGKIVEEEDLVVEFPLSAPSKVLSLGRTR
jgi:hypothetical protein